jgi:superfamily I DNA/RNA helicase/mRNA-degrading endonuclease RelE of RelBE toxin-antitoxin system
MDFRIADTFTESLARLNGDEQKAVKTTAFDLQMNPSQPGLSFHRLDRAKDKNFWSVRVSGDVRLIVHRSESSLLLCYVGHHDDAYAWAERRKLETHARTGAAQWVEIRETVKEIVVPRYVAPELVAEPVTAPPPAPAKQPFAETPDDELLGYGVPPEWLSDVKHCTEESLLGVVEHLPAEAAEALLELATGGKPAAPARASATTSPFDHPDAQRRFRVVANLEELQRALEFPWEKWTVFLHPEQRQLVERGYSGPARVSGSAGTGKTIVALHRAAHLARKHPDARILLTTFSETLANALRTKLKRLLSNAPRLGERIDVHAIDAIGLRLYKTHVGPATIGTRELVRSLMAEASKAVPGHKFGAHFLLTEWDHVVDAWGLSSWEEYRDVARLGRKTRLSEAQRRMLWSIFERVRNDLKARSTITMSDLFGQLAAALRKNHARPFDFAVVDESQDLSVAHVRFLAALGGGGTDALFFAGDLGQRIFQQPFSWKSLGVDVRGRSRTLRVNYRTSHQIRSQADRLLEAEITDVDGNVEARGRTVSVFNGPPPLVQSFDRADGESAMVGAWLAEQAKDGVLAHECGIFVRSPREFPRAHAAAKAAALPFVTLDDRVETRPGHLSIGTMHLAKGLEFRVVAVMACDDEILPSQERIESVGDDADLKEVYDTERQLLYVACTRARDRLLVTGVNPASEFLQDLGERKLPSTPSH